MKRSSVATVDELKWPRFSKCSSSTSFLVAASATASSRKGRRPTDGSRLLDAPFQCCTSFPGSSSTSMFKSPRDNPCMAGGSLLDSPQQHERLVVIDLRGEL